MQPDPVELKCCDRFCCGKSSTRGRLKKPVGKRELARSSEGNVAVKERLE
jgi:hypothetical protein